MPTKRENRLIFKNENFLKWLQTKEFKNHNKYISGKLIDTDWCFIGETDKRKYWLTFFDKIFLIYPKLLFLFVKEYLEEKYNVTIVFRGNSKVVQIFDTKPSLNYFLDRHLTGLDYKKEWCGLLSCWEWLIKNENN